ncbi:MAG: DNA-3-methyladenine glycosylase [Chloroflexota bacterium]
MTTVSTRACRIRPRPPFSFQVALGYLGRSPRELLDVVDRPSRTYERAVFIDGAPCLLGIADAGTPDAPALDVAVSSHAPERHLDAAVALAQRVLQVDVDTAPLGDAVRHDPVFSALVRRFQGARVVQSVSPFETLIWAVLGQQINVAFAYALKARMVQRYGDRLDHDGRTFWLFPPAERLAEASLDELREMQFSRQKAAYVTDLAHVEAQGRINWDALRRAPTEEAVSTLTSLRGVGRWTAEYVCMRGLAHPDVIPAADIGLRSAIGKAYGMDRNATEAEVRELAEGWAGWRSHAAFCWWYSLSAARQA